jgi:hypothetical protein
MLHRQRGASGCRPALRISSVSIKRWDHASNTAKVTKRLCTSHIVSKDEAKFVFEKGCRQLILGSGQDGNVQLSLEADAFFAKKNCEVVIKPTPQAIRAFNEAPGKKIGLFHITC